MFLKVPFGAHRVSALNSAFIRQRRDINVYI
jgi:hypothetical protein